MLNNIIFFTIAILFIYVAVFTAYFSLVVCASFLKQRKRRKDNTKLEYKNLIVVIYSHNNEKTIVNLLEQLNKQDYPKGNYQIHIILDNCSDNSANKLEFVGGAKLWKLNDDLPLGKDKAISWLLENLMSFKRVDGYVFLNANRMVRNDFLSRINDALHRNNVVVGSTEIVLEDADYCEKVWANINEYNNNVMKIGRSILNLAVPIDSDVTAMNHEVLEKIQCIDFKDANSELKYSFLLTRVNYPPQFAPEIKTYVSSIDYTVNRPTFAYKMSLFFHCLDFKSFTNFKFCEFLFSLFKPNPIVLMCILTLIATYSFNYYFVLDFPWAIFLAVVLTIMFGFSIYRSHQFIRPLIYLATGPFYTLSDVIYSNKICGKLFNFAKHQKKENTDVITVPVNITNGRNIFPCFLELSSEDGFKKAKLRYKNKNTETTQTYVRMCDAVKNIAEMLEQRGFRLKICQSCAYFAPKIDGTNNMVKGYCNKKAVENENCCDLPETLLWSSCEYFIPEEVNNVINISTYIKNREQ